MAIAAFSVVGRAKNCAAGGLEAVEQLRVDAVADDDEEAVLAAGGVDGRRRVAMSSSR